MRGKRCMRVLSLVLVFCLSIGLFSFSAVAKTKKGSKVKIKKFKVHTCHDLDSDEGHCDFDFCLGLPPAWITKYGKPYKVTCETDVDTFKADYIKKSQKKKWEGLYVYQIIFYDDESEFDGSLKKGPYRFKFYFKDEDGDTISYKWNLTRSMV